MREIKFRAWHSLQEKMYSAEELGFDQLILSVDGRGFVNVHGGEREKSVFLGSMIPEQFIGRRDKNGVEIYEGDVLEAVTSSGMSLKTVIEWHDERGSWSMFFPPDQFAVIGNIHQNPELLK